MIGRERDVAELGSRAAGYMIVENDLPIGSRIAAIAYRFFYTVAPVTCVR